MDPGGGLTLSAIAASTSPKYSPEGHADSPNTLCTDLLTAKTGDGTLTTSRVGDAQPAFEPARDAQAFEPLRDALAAAVDQHDRPEA